MMMVGIDEAGKGPVIGPMCIAGVCADEELLKKFRLMGVDDSKKLTPKKREQLAAEIRKYAEGRWFILEVAASQIDDLRKIMTMNEVMVVCFSKVLEGLSDLPFDSVILDAADVSEERFARRVKETFSEKFPEKAEKITYISHHKADAMCPAVSAASILAKVRRDELVSEISKKENADFGSGYPSDPKTKKFLADWLLTHDDFPYYVRKSWKTASSLLPENKRWGYVADKDE